MNLIYLTSKRTFLILLAGSLFAILESCIPHQAQVTLNAEDIMLHLQDTTLTLPDSNTSFRLEAGMLTEVLTQLPHQSVGTVQVHLSRALSLSSYLVLPVTLHLVAGSGGLYLFLLEQQHGIFMQRQAVKLGQDVELARLEARANTIVAVTVDPRRGKPPFADNSFRLNQAGEKRFELADGQLREIY
jgi:hypothetical protein